MSFCHLKKKTCLCHMLMLEHSLRDIHIRDFNLLEKSYYFHFSKQLTQPKRNVDFSLHGALEENCSNHFSGLPIPTFNTSYLNRTSDNFPLVYNYCIRKDIKNYIKYESL